MIINCHSIISEIMNSIGFKVFEFYHPKPDYGNNFSSNKIQQRPIRTKLTNPDIIQYTYKIIRDGSKLKTTIT